MQLEQFLLQLRAALVDAGAARAAVDLAAERRQIGNDQRGQYLHCTQHYQRPKRAHAAGRNRRDRGREPAAEQRHHVGLTGEPCAQVAHGFGRRLHSVNSFIDACGDIGSD